MCRRTRTSALCSPADRTTRREQQEANAMSASLCMHVGCARGFTKNSAKSDGPRSAAGLGDRARDSWYISLRKSTLSSASQLPLASGLDNPPLAASLRPVPPVLALDRSCGSPSGLHAAYRSKVRSVLARLLLARHDLICVPRMQISMDAAVLTEDFWVSRRAPCAWVSPTLFVLYLADGSSSASRRGPAQAPAFNPVSRSDLMRAWPRGVCRRGAFE